MSEIKSEVVFADTNVWLYALLETQDAVKSAKAKAIIRENKLVTSTQVVNEVCVNLLKKARFSEAQIRELIIAFYERQVVVQLGQEALIHASTLRARYQLSYWDSTMLASALMAGAQIFYTEDMQDGLLVENTLRLINPFVPKSTAAS